MQREVTAPSPRPDPSLGGQLLFLTRPPAPSVALAEPQVGGGDTQGLWLPGHCLEPRCGSETSPALHLGPNPIPRDPVPKQSWVLI